MCLVTDGTTMNGYRCDVVGCRERANYTPLIVIPYERRPFTKGNMFVGMVNFHVCREHFKHIEVNPFLGPKMREAAKYAANKSLSKPDFDHAVLKPWRVHSSEYIDFMRAGGFVPLDDAKADGRILLP